MTEEDVEVKYITSEDAAIYLSVSPRYLSKLRTTGGGPRFVKLGKLIRYRYDWLDQWAEQRVCHNTVSASNVQTGRR